MYVYPPQCNCMHMLNVCVMLENNFGKQQKMIGNRPKKKGNQQTNRNRIHIDNEEQDKKKIIWKKQ